MLLQFIKWQAGRKLYNSFVYCALSQLMARNQLMQQNKDKVEGTLISILLLTQITELKMLVDIGRQGHRLYDVVLALLVSSVGALVLVGLIVLYVGNLRFYRRHRTIATARYTNEKHRTTSSLYDTE